MSEQSLSQVDLNLLILEIRSMLPIELDDTNEANVEELAFGALEKVTEGLLNRFNCLVAITQERNYKLLSHIELLESKTENFRPGDFVVAKQIAREVGWVDGYGRAVSAHNHFANLMKDNGIFGIFIVGFFFIKF